VRTNISNLPQDKYKQLRKDEKGDDSDEDAVIKRLKAKPPSKAAAGSGKAAVVAKKGEI